MTDGDASQVTTQLALLNQSIQALTGLVKANHDELKSLITDHEERIRALERSTTEIASRQTTLAIIQSTFTAIASGAAALFGKQP